MARSGKVLGTRIPDETMGKLIDAVLALSGYPHRMTKAGLVTDAIEAHVAKLAGDHNGGKPFPVTDRRLSPGRRSDGEGKTDDPAVGKRKPARVGARAKPRRKRADSKSGSAKSVGGRASGGAGRARRRPAK